METSPPTGFRAQELQGEVLDLYQQHSASLLKYAASVVRNQDEACDAVQEAYLRYFIQRRYGRQIGNPRAWLCQVLRNYLLDRMKAMPQKREVHSEGLEGIADQGQNPEKLLQGREVAAEIAAALTGRELHCLSLHAGGLRYEEIADAMDVRPGTVGALLSRVHRKLRRSRAEWMSTGLTDAVFSFLVEGHANSHPDIESLACYREGDLPPERGKALKRHLDYCPECRLEYQRLADAWSSDIDRTAPASALDDSTGLANLLEGIQGWQTAAADSGRTGDGTKRRVASHVERYFGTAATSRILLAVSEDGSNLLSTVEPVLALFLGRKAASCLVSHVVDTAIVRI